MTVDDENEEMVTDAVWKETTFMGELITSFHMIVTVVLLFRNC